MLAFSFVRHALPPPPRSDLVPRNESSQSLDASKLNALKLSAPKMGQRSGGLAPIHQEQTSPDEIDTKKHRHHKHKKKKKRKHKRKDQTTATRSEMPAHHVELAQQLIHNPSTLAPPAEKGVKSKKKVATKQLEFNKVQSAYSHQVGNQDMRCRLDL